MANHANQIRQENFDKPVTRRGRRFIEFDAGSGRRQYVTTIDPLHLRASEVEIDATWYPDTGAWQWRIGDNDWQAHARDVFNVGNLIEWRHESGEWVIVDPQSINWINQDNSRQQIEIKQAVAGTANDATLTYSNAYGAGRHFSYTAHPRRLIKYFTLDTNNLPAPTVTGTIHLEVEWTIANSSGVELYLDGVRWARTNGARVRTGRAIEFRSETTGAVMWTADAPTGYDANGDTVSCEYEVMRQGAGYFIRVRVPKTWIDAAVFPITIDPTFTDGYGGDVDSAYDNWLYSSDSTTNYATSQTSRVNSNTSTFILRFSLSSISPGSTCDSATLTLVTGGALGDVTNSIYILAVANRDWTETGSTWNTKDGTNNWAGSNGAKTATTDYLTPAIGSYAVLSTDPAGTSDDVSLTASTVDDFFGGAIDVVIHGGSTTQDWVCTSDHATTGYRPKLVVVYTAGDASVTAEIATATAAGVAPEVTGSIATQKAYPTADASAGNWTGEGGETSNLYTHIDETTASDSDYVKSEETPSSSPFVVQLGSLTDPSDDTNHVLSYRYLKSATGAGTINLTVQLRQNYTSEGSPGDLIAQWQHNDIGAVTQNDGTLTAGEAGSISAYSSLYVRFVADSA